MITEGHWRGGPHVRVLIESGDDVDGHAFAIHFPTAAEADAFRRRLVLAGVLAGTVAVGTAGVGVGVANLPASDAGTAGTATVVQSSDANADIGLMDLSNATQTAAAAADDEVDAVGGPIPR